MKFLDDFHHSRGQKDGAQGKPYGDILNKKYDEGYSAGRFDYDKKRFGETYARLAKAEKDFARRISEGGKKSKEAGEEAAMKEESHREVDYCPFCGSEYDGGYCYNCEDEEYEEPSPEELERQKREREFESIVRTLDTKSQYELEKIVEHDNNSDIRRAAVMKITSQYELEKIAESNPYTQVRKEAVNRINNQYELERIARNDPSPEVRIFALSKLGSQYELDYISRHDSNSEVREVAKVRLEKFKLQESSSININKITSSPVQQRKVYGRRLDVGDSGNREQRKPLTLIGFLLQSFQRKEY